MKTALLITTIALLTACSSNPNKVSEKDNDLLKGRQVKNLEYHLEKSSINKGAFCNGEGFKWYHESKTYYHFTCKDGGVFSLKKG
jgi:hypothetical protein